MTQQLKAIALMLLILLFAAIIVYAGLALVRQVTPPAYSIYIHQVEVGR